MYNKFRKRKVGDNVKDRTLGIIYALKLGKYAADENLRMFLSEWSASNWSYFGRNDIDRMLRQTIADYLANCGNSNEIRRYFDENAIWIVSEYDKMISFLQQARVRDDSEFVNGFRDNPYPNYRVFAEV